jgi:hypothetical protein
MEVKEMYGHKLIFESNAFELGMTLPVDETVLAENGLRVGGQEGLLAVVVVAKTACVIGLGHKLTLSLQDSSDDGVADAYAAVAPAVSQVTTFAAETSFAVGDVLTRFLIPMGIDKWAKVSVGTDDANDVEGTIDVALEYLAN